MHRRRVTRGEWAALLACAAAIAVIFATGVLNRGKVWANIALEGDCSLSLEQGDAYGTVGGGPYYDLPAGEYRLRWRLDADGENIIRFVSSNDTEIVPPQAVTDPGLWEDEITFTLKDAAHNFSIFVDFTSGTRMQLDDLRLYSPEYTDGAWLAALLLAGGWLLLVLWRRIPDEEGRRILALLAVAVVAASAPMLRENIAKSYDTQFHAARIMNRADGLRSGQIPVRVGGFSYNGYGAATSVFYPDVLLYPLALMVLGGASISFVLGLLIVAINIAAAAIMYLSALHLFGDRRISACSAILYVCAVYRVNRLYHAYMVGQGLGMAMLPLFLLGLWEVCWGDRRRWPVLAAGATLIFQSHMLTTVLCAVLALAAVVLRFGALVRERRLSALFKAIGVTLLLNLWTLVPFVMLYSSGVTTAAVHHDFAGVAPELTDVLMMGGTIDAMLLPGLALFISMRRPAPAQDGGWRAARICAVAGVCAALMSTRLFPWSHVSLLTGGLVEVIQYPGRLLMLWSVMLSLCAGYAYVRALGEGGRLAPVLVLAVSLLCMSPYLQHTIQDGAVLDYGQGANPYMVTPEYQIEGTDVGDTRSRAVLVEGDVTLTQYEKRGTQVSAGVRAQTDAVLTLPLFGFDGYAASLDGERIPVGLGQNNRLTVHLPAGADGTLRVWYAGKAVWRVCDGISLATLAALLAYAARRRRKKGAAPGEA